MFRIQTLRDAIINKQPIEFEGDLSFNLENINNASNLKINEKTYPLNSKTNFFNQLPDDKQTLKAVIFCWLHDKLSIVDYKNDCSKYDIADFKFLVKTDLNTWLQGNSDSCKFVEDDTPSTTSLTNGTKHKIEGDESRMSKIGKFEVESIDHNIILRGSKNLEFNYLLKDAKSFINQLKKSKPSSAGRNSSRNLKLPIILLSPATSALLSLSNIKLFLEESKFVDPTTNVLPKPDNGIVIINHKTDKLHPAAHKITVVDNVDFFTKPEYWDRVIGIFTTGQSWQFNKYKYSTPEVLFQKYPGFYMCYQTDVVPKLIKDWNVNQVRVDRDKRFRDKMIVNDFWGDLEKILIQRGYGV